MDASNLNLKLKFSSSLSHLLSKLAVRQTTWQPKTTDQISQGVRHGKYFGTNTIYYFHRYKKLKLAEGPSPTWKWDEILMLENKSESLPQKPIPSHDNIILWTNVFFLGSRARRLRWRWENVFIVTWERWRGLGRIGPISLSQAFHKAMFK